jgi:hypothetical protein
MRTFGGRTIMSHFHLHRPPPKVPWWQRLWDRFKANFPGRSAEHARSFALTMIIFATLLLLTRIFFALRGIPV